MARRINLTEIQLSALHELAVRRLTYHELTRAVPGLSGTTIGSLVARGLAAAVPRGDHKAAKSWEITPTGWSAIGNPAIPGRGEWVPVGCATDPAPPAES